MEGSGVPAFSEENLARRVPTKIRRRESKNKDGMEDENVDVEGDEVFSDA